MKGLFDADPAVATIRILTRRSRRSYGTSCYVDYVEGIHDPTKRYIVSANIGCTFANELEPVLEIATVVILK